MLIELLERLFSRPGDTSRQAVKNRLKLVLAHDRTDLPPQTLEALRQEILEVVSRYVELDTESMEFSLANSDRTTALIANLPIRRLRNLAEESQPVSADPSVMAALDFNVEALELEPITPTEPFNRESAGVADAVEAVSPETLNPAAPDSESGQSAAIDLTLPDMPPEVSQSVPNKSAIE